MSGTGGRIESSGWEARPARRRLAIRHLPFLAIFTMAVALRATAVLGFRQALWFYADSYAFLGAALHPRPSTIRPVGYAFLLRALEPSHSLLTVAVVQHLLGLALGAMVYVLLRRNRLSSPLAALAAAPVLLDAYQIELEHLLMADVAFTVLVIGAVALVLWRTSAGPAAVAGLALGAAVTIRTVGLPLVVVLIGYLLIRRVGWRAPLTALGCFAAPVLAYAAWFHSWHGQYALTRSDGAFLWSRTAVFADCAKIKPPARLRPLCPDLPPEGRPPSAMLLWRRDMPLYRLPGGPFTPHSARLARDFALTAIAAQPADFARTVADGLALTFRWDRPDYPSASIAQSLRFPSVDQPPPLLQRIRGGAADIATYTRGGDGVVRVVEPYGGLLRLYQRHVYLPGTVLAGALLLGLGGMARRWRDLGGPALLPWAVAVTLLVVPVAVADFDYRYVLPAVPAACLAAGLALARSPARHDDLDHGPDRSHPGEARSRLDADQGQGVVDPRR